MADKLDPFTQGYIDCALWCSTATGSPDEPAEGDPARDSFDTSFEQANYGADDLTPRLLAHIVDECKAFQEDYREDLDEAMDNDKAYDSGQAGHDFWLTRNGHGAGFWDRGLGDVGDTLTQAAKAYGTEDWYVVRNVEDDNDYGQIDY